MTDLAEMRALAESILGAERWAKKPTVPEVAPLVRELYARNAAGCCLHVLLDDHNVSDNTAAFCLDWATKRNCDDPEACKRLAALILRMSPTQRGKLGKYTIKPHPAELVAGAYLGR